MDTMASCEIRKYKNSDYETVRDIFSAGMSELHPAVVLHMLKQPCSLLALMCLFCVLLLSSKSFLLPILGVTLLVALIRYWILQLSNNYITKSLNSDLLDIRQTYLENQGCCFWVAESGGCVVGIVAARPAVETQEHLELLRMSVRRAYRGRGIAKALCRTVISFARQNGYKAVVLSTSEVQVAAQKLYENTGFKKWQTTAYKTPMNFIFNLTIYRYRYDMPTTT